MRLPVPRQRWKSALSFNKPHSGLPRSFGNHPNASPSPVTCVAATLKTGPGCNHRGVRKRPVPDPVIALLFFAASVFTRLPSIPRSVLDWDESLYFLMAEQWRLGHLAEQPEQVFVDQDSWSAQL
jgi:hypothetical protein